MKGAQWVDIRSDRQKGLSYVERGKKYHMKQAVIKRLLKQEDSTLKRPFEDFAGFYGFKPILWTKGKVERTVQFVRDNFMVGIKYNETDGRRGKCTVRTGQSD